MYHGPGLEHVSLRTIILLLVFFGDSAVKNLTANAGDTQIQPALEDLWRRKWQPTPVFLPGKTWQATVHWAKKESDILSN